MNTSENIIFPRSTPQPPRAFATVCHSSISVWHVNVEVDVRTGNVTNISAISSFLQHGADFPGPPFNGNPYNGIKFDLTITDKFILDEQNTIQLQLTNTIYQMATQSPGGYIGTFINGNFSRLSDKLYVGTFW